MLIAGVNITCLYWIAFYGRASYKEQFNTSRGRWLKKKYKAIDNHHESTKMLRRLGNLLSTLHGLDVSPRPLAPVGATPQDTFLVYETFWLPNSPCIWADGLGFLVHGIVMLFRFFGGVPQVAQGYPGVPKGFRGRCHNGSDRLNGQAVGRLDQLVKRYCKAVRGLGGKKRVISNGFKMKMGLG